MREIYRALRKLNKTNCKHAIYFNATALEAVPPKLLFTVMFSGFAGQDSEALNRPFPLFLNVPMRAPVAVTCTRKVAVGSVPVASTLNTPFDR